MTASSVTPRPTSTRRPWTDTRRKNALGYSFVLLPLAYVFLVLLLPILYNVWISLHDWSLVDPTPPKFIGLGNYIDILTNPRWLGTIGRTAIFVVASVSCQIVGGVVVAMFLYKRYPHARLLRLLLLLPMLVSEVVVGNVWRLMFNYDGGFINGILSLVGIPPVFWLGPDLAFVSVVVADIWQQLPFVMLVIFAALQTVPHEITEAAEIDGSRGFQTFWYIILPVIRPALLLVLLFETMFAVRAFSTVWVLTQGGPGTSTTLLAVDVYRVALQSFDVGLSAALSCILLAISLLIAVLYIRWLKRDPLS